MTTNAMISGSRPIAKKPSLKSGLILYWTTNTSLKKLAATSKLILSKQSKLGQFLSLIPNKRYEKIVLKSPYINTKITFKTIDVYNELEM